MPEKVVSSERRVEERSNCELPGKIKISDGRVIVCVVKDLSATGVRIVIHPSTHVPDQFDLLVPAVPGADQLFAVRLIWRNEDEIGGEFSSPAH